VAAQQKGQLEAGLFGRFTLLDRDLHLDDGPGLGGRLGYFFVPRLAIEADGSYTRLGVAEDMNVSVMPLHARLLWDVPAWDRVSLLLGAGYARYSYGGDLEESVSDDGVGGLVGLRFHQCGPLSFRLEGTLDHFSSPDVTLVGSDDVNVDNWGIQFGASLFFGKKSPCDADGDGVADEIDRCPDTPKGEAVDAYGCPLPGDSDGDGVLDPQDRCPDTPRGEKVDASGCPLPKDSDGDGVTDKLDKCPNTPRGERVDATGCPLPKDSDGDGVLDPQDKCPNTPKGTQVDADGCPKVFEEGKKELILEGVNFETGKATLLPESKAILDKVGASLANYPNLKVEVAGHTDSRGAHAMNMKLSQSRAETVREYLIGKGVAGSQLTAKGYGPDKPIADNKTDAGRAENRRVELHRMD
jgi:outer membrane protein OmpA-like peptidoglycan-associated protein